MSYAPLAPVHRAEPEQLAPDTWLIHSVQEALGQPLFVYLNSMVIKGKEPIILDTNTIANRKQFLEDAFNLVDPADVKWIYLSHDDVDHTGNLEEVMDACPNATVVCSWAMLERHSNALEWPMNRIRWVNDGESFNAGDRTLRAIRPPVWDSPTTRGLFDESTGVYWGVDSFATPMPGGVVSDYSELDPGFAAEGMAMFIYNALSPWLEMVDPKKYAAKCNEIQALGATTIATAHAPIIRENSMDKAFEILRELPNVPCPPAPNQDVLEAILSGAGQ
jgi:flavorubredoxin